MLRAIKAIWDARKGFRWSLYFVKKDEGLRYALHENSVMLLLGYVLAAIEKGKQISDEWELHINYNRRHKSIRLREHFFSNGQVSAELISRISEIDSDWIVPNGVPVFVDVRTQKALPLGAFGITFKSKKQQIDEVKNLLSGKYLGVTTLDSVMREVFVN